MSSRYFFLNSIRSLFFEFNVRMSFVLGQFNDYRVWPEIFEGSNNIFAEGRYSKISRSNFRGWMTAQPTIYTRLAPPINNHGFTVMVLSLTEPQSTKVPSFPIHVARALWQRATWPWIGKLRPIARRLEERHSRKTKRRNKLV